jgi:hypothetical protein
MVLGRGRSITSTRLTIHAKSRSADGAVLRPRRVTRPGRLIAAMSVKPVPMPLFRTIQVCPKD